MNSDSTHQPQSSSPDAYRANEVSESPPGDSSKHIRRAAIGGFLGTCVVVTLQWLAPSFDHQYANMLSILAAAVAGTFVIFQLHRWSLKRGSRWRVLLAVLTVFVCLSALFQFDGFSGEMLPQFQFRFGNEPLELRTLKEPLANTPAEVQPSDEVTSNEVTSNEVPSEDVESRIESLGFLGSDRNGVIGTREFDADQIPQSVEKLWDQGIGEGWSSFAVAGDRAVTLEQRDELECVTCYRLSDGELLWIVSHEARHENALGGIGPRSTPTIDGDRVFAQGATGRVWCLDLRTGETFWTVDLLELAGWGQVESETAISWGRATSPLIIDRLCVVPFGGPEEMAETGRSLVAFDVESGDVRWTAGEDQVSYGSPGLLMLAGTRQIVSVNEKTITGHKIDSGDVLWEFDWPGQSNGGANCAMVVPAGADRFLIGKGYGGGSALVEIQADEDGTLSADAVWQSTRLLKTKFTHACVDGDIAYAISNGSLEAVAIESAEKLWQQPRRSRFGQGQILLVDDVLVAQSESGEVAFVAADQNEYRELARIPAMSSKTWNIPTVAGGYLLVRNDRQAICFALPLRNPR